MAKYSKEATELLVKIWKETGSVENFAAMTGKPVKSAIMKLTQLGLYTSARKNKQPTKAEIVSQIEDIVGENLTGLEVASKQSLLKILTFLAK